MSILEIDQKMFCGIYSLFSCSLRSDNSGQYCQTQAVRLKQNVGYALRIFQQDLTFTFIQVHLQQNANKPTAYYYCCSQLYSVTVITYAYLKNIISAGQDRFGCCVEHTVRVTFEKYQLVFQCQPIYLSKSRISTQEQLSVQEQLTETANRIEILGNMDEWCNVG